MIRACKKASGVKTAQLNRVYSEGYAIVSVLRARLPAVEDSLVKPQPAMAFPPIQLNSELVMVALRL